MNFFNLCKAKEDCLTVPTTLFENTIDFTNQYKKYVLQWVTENEPCIRTVFEKYCAEKPVTPFYMISVPLQTATGTGTSTAKWSEPIAITKHEQLVKTINLKDAPAFVLLNKKDNTIATLLVIIKGPLGNLQTKQESVGFMVHLEFRDLGVTWDWPKCLRQFQFRTNNNHHLF